MITLKRCEKIDETVVFGLDYKNDTTGVVEYTEIILSQSELSTTPTKVEIMQKLKQKASEIPTFETRLPDGTVKTELGKSILEILKEKTAKAVINQKLSAFEGTDVSGIET